jgi:hypothetical protein
MPIDLYSKRNKKPIDVYVYDSISEKLKNQIEYIWKKYVGQLDSESQEEFWKLVNRTVCEEHGKKTLKPKEFGSKFHDWYKVESYFDSLENVDECLDVIEIIFRFILKIPKIAEENNIRILGEYDTEEVFEDLNTRFLENGVGYTFQDKRIVRIDNLLLHKEILLETLQFLSTKTFSNANEEFLNAHSHFRHRRYKECINDCLKSLETTLKIICSENGWPYNITDTSKKLLETCTNNKLVPTFLTSHYTSLLSTIESGVPSIRNKLTGHGQGSNKIQVPDHFASYVLYLTGTTINFLISCQKEIKSFE